jgi:endoglucanase
MLKRWLWIMVFGLLVLPNFAQEEVPTMQRCVNLGNMLEAPNEGEWGHIVEKYFFEDIAEAGFDTVRIPTKWSNHAATSAPYTIDADFMARVKQVVDWALAENLNVVLNVHHYDEMAQNPDDHVERLVAIWSQIAEAFADYPSTLSFELMNEPNSAMTADKWNAIYPQLIEVIRPTNPTRTLIFGGVNWNSIDSLRDLELPENTDNLLITFHYYSPFEFTHQGAEWVDGTDAYLGTTWSSSQDYVNVVADFARAQDWAEEHGVRLWLGEFGAYSKADLASRELYTDAVRTISEVTGIGWCYWELAAGFGIYDKNTREFNSLYEALIPAQ